MKKIFIFTVILLCCFGSTSFGGSYEKQLEAKIIKAKDGNVDDQFEVGACYYDGDKIKQDYEKAFYWFNKSAEQGHARSQFFLGHMFFSGRGVSQNYKQSVEWFTKSAEQGDADAQNYLGHIYAEGKAVKKDFKKAVSWLKKAIEQGNSTAWCELGSIYRDETYELHDYVKAIKFFTKAIEFGVPPLSNIAIANLNSMHIDEQGKTRDFLIAVEPISKLAQQGNPYAQFFLGTIYSDYSEPTGDLFKSFEWFFKAAEQGHELSILKLKSSLYYFGNILKDGDDLLEYYKKTIDGLPQYLYQMGSLKLASGKTEQAIRFITQAAEKGDHKAQVKLGLIFYQGEGIEQDYKKSFYWANKAATQGNPQGELLLGEIYRLGNGVTQNYQKSFEWFFKAAEHGNANAQYNLFRLYVLGEGIPKNFNKGFEWLLKSADQGFRQAQYMAGMSYYDGADVGVTQNYEESFKWFTKAAEAGHPESQFQLGCSYILGKGTEANVVDGYAWFIVAKALGDKKACEVVEKLQKELSQEQIFKGQNVASTLWEKLRKKENYIKPIW